MATNSSRAASTAHIAELIAQQRFAEARAALAQGPPDGERLTLLYQLGSGLLSAGQYQGAEHAFRLLLRAAPASWEAAYALGASLERQGRAADAIAAFESALRLNPASREARSKLEAHKRSAGMPPEADPPANPFAAPASRPSAPRAARTRPEPPLGQLLDQHAELGAESLLRVEHRRISSFAHFLVLSALLVLLGVVLTASAGSGAPGAVAAWLVPGDALELAERIRLAEYGGGPNPLSESLRAELEELDARTVIVSRLLVTVFGLAGAAAISTGLLVLLYPVVAGRVSRYRLFPYRLEIDSGVLSRKTTSVWLHDIRDVLLLRRPLQVLTGNGTVQLQTDKGTFQIVGFGDWATTERLGNELRAASLIERRAMKRWWS